MKMPFSVDPSVHLDKVLVVAGKVSVIVPTYNEAENIGKVFEEINRLPLNKEVVIVDDHSPDGTDQVVKRTSNEYGNVKLLIRPRKMGIGSAYKDGLKLCSGDVIVEMDADLSHNPIELPKIVDALQCADMVVGSRYIDGGRIVGWKWYRKLVNRGANLLARVVLGLKVRDSTSGFRAYRRPAFEQIASMSKFDGFEFQVEALCIAEKLGFKVAEVPITFTDRRQGKSKLKFKDIINFAKAIFKMQLRPLE